MVLGHPRSRKFSEGHGLSISSHYISPIGRALRRARKCPFFAPQRGFTRYTRRLL